MLLFGGAVLLSPVIGTSLSQSSFSLLFFFSSGLGLWTWKRASMALGWAEMGLGRAAMELGWAKGVSVKAGRGFGVRLGLVGRWAQVGLGFGNIGKMRFEIL